MHRQPSLVLPECRGRLPGVVKFGRVALTSQQRIDPCAAEREGDNLEGFQDSCLNNGSSQGLSVDWTVLHVPSLLDSG